MARRTDAARNSQLLLDAAMRVFASSGVDVPIRKIADEAGVGTATLYRHFPNRSDLIVAIFRQHVDRCAAAAHGLGESLEPVDALFEWLRLYLAFIEEKRGLAQALQSGDPAYESLPMYFQQSLRPALSALIAAAVESGEIRDDVDPTDLLRAVASLCIPAHDVKPGFPRRMLELLLHGLRSSG